MKRDIDGCRRVRVEAASGGWGSLLDPVALRAGGPAPCRPKQQSMDVYIHEVDSDVKFALRLLGSSRILESRVMSEENKACGQSYVNILGPIA